MPKIIHTAHYFGTPWEILRSVVPEGYDIMTLKEPTSECLLRQVVDADYLLVSGRLPIGEEVLSAAHRLKMIQRTGVGIEMLDLEAIRSRNIPVYVNAGVNARSVAEHTITLMLCCLKNIPQISSRVKIGIWQKQQTGVTCNELFGKTVGLVGMGSIGKQVATYLKAFDVNVLYTDIFKLSDDEEKSLNITYVPSVDELLPNVDILSLHCPLTSQSKKMLNSRTIAMMKTGAIVINTARGKLIDETALYEALTIGKLRTAALDVHYEEPIKNDNPLLSLDNVIMTPHIGGLTYEAFRRMMSSAVDNIVAFEMGEKSKIASHLLNSKE